MGRQSHLFIWHKSTFGVNAELKHYWPELYEAFNNLTIWNIKNLINLPVRKFSVDPSFPMEFFCENYYFRKFVL